MLVEEQKYKGFTIQIHQDEFAENPRKMGEHLGTMVCFHNRYTLSDENHGFYGPQDLINFLNYGENYYDITEFLEDHEEIIDIKVDEKYLPFYLPLYLYDHSGITMKTGPFYCPWDSGQVGFIFIEQDKAREEWGDIPDLEEKAKACMEAEIEEFDNFITDNVFGFVTENENGDEIDSCWGFCGDPEKSGLLEEAKSTINYYIEKKRKERVNKLKELIMKKVPLEMRQRILANI